MEVEANQFVTAYAALFVEFEKTPISCRVTGVAYNTICYLMRAKLAIQVIKNIFIRK